MEPLKGVGTLFFCDETKFSKNDQDAEDAIYYFAVAVPKKDVPKISNEFNELLKKRRIQAKTFHSTSIFKKNRVREELMTDLTSLLINNHLSCFCIKYEKSWMLEPTKHLSYLNNDILNFNDAEFQALFYFLVILNLFFKQPNSVKLEKNFIMYFDRNVYGKESTEPFNFPDKQFVFDSMTFVEKSQISLLALADFVGFIFRKSKISQNKVQFGNNELETEPLIINSYSNMVKLNQSGLFKFIETDEHRIRSAIEQIIENR